MKFRAIAVDFQLDGRSLQAMSNSMEDIHDWARKMSNLHGCRVDIYQTYERLLKRVRPLGPKNRGNK